MQLREPASLLSDQIEEPKIVCTELSLHIHESLSGWQKPDAFAPLIDVDRGQLDRRTIGTHCEKGHAFAESLRFAMQLDDWSTKEHNPDS
jgi:hypothetical protein